MYRNNEERRTEIRNAVRKEIKNLIGPVIFVLVLAAAIITVALITPDPDEIEQLEVRKFETDKTHLVYENDYLKFDFDPATTYFTITDKKTGETWDSVPSEGARDTLAQTSEKENLQSTFTITYRNSNGADLKYNNYKYSISGGLYTVEPVENGVKVNYTVGEVEKIYYVPEVLPAERFDQIIAQMSKDNGFFVKDCFTYYSYENLDPNDPQDAEILTNYASLLENGGIRLLPAGTRANKKKQIEKYLVAAGYTEEDYYNDLQYAVRSSDFDKPVFNISVIYKLDGRDLVVSIPTDEIEYKSSYPITGISLLPYFGAGGTDDEGYLLVPEGGGSIIRFNNGRVKQNTYYASVYGWDYAQARKELVRETRVNYGVFGIGKNGSSMICILEDGSSFASINADISGKINSYNNVFASYRLLHSEEVDVGARTSSRMYLYESELPSETLCQRYRFEDSDSVVVMANAYHDYLCEKLGDDFSLNSTTSSAPLAVEILCAVDKVESVLGVPVSKPLALTTYDEASELISELSDLGFDNLSIKLSGWMNDGLNQKMLTRVKLIDRLGSKKDFKELLKVAASKDVSLYLDAVTQYVYDTNLFEGFFLYTDAACYANKKRAELNSFSTVYFGIDEDYETYYLLNPGLVSDMMNNIKDYALKNDAYGISYRDTGYMLSADYKRKARVSREESLRMQVADMKAAKNSGLSIMTNVGNDYVFGIADLITNCDLAGYDYTILDAEVPFLFIALHGYTDYCGEPLNLTADITSELLKSVESGAGLSFSFMKEDAQALQNTLYSNYFGSDYDSFKDRFVEIYTRYNNELGHTFNQRIVGWQQLESGVTVTEYEDGTKAYVNTLYTEFTTASGITVPARDYVVER